MSNLLRLIYVSRAVAAVDPESIETLLKQARQGNEKLNSTDALCTGRGYFERSFQRLESSTAACRQRGRRVQKVLGIRTEPGFEEAYWLESDRAGLKFELSV